ncbi:MAG: hypothetical protein ACTH2Y_11490 [Corynebacterium sp.]|uniref:hypothetical protein n=1 Tax=unclassified Corynebacterium TaxID=2624378 RepID=UPI003F8FCA35
MMDLASDAIRYVAPALIAGIVTLAMARLGKGDKGEPADPTLPESAVQHYQQFVDQMNDFTGMQIKELKRLHRASVERVDRLEKRVSVLESKYRAALDFIRTLIRRHPDSSDDIPAEIRHDL